MRIPLGESGSTRSIWHESHNLEHEIRNHAPCLPRAKKNALRREHVKQDHEPPRHEPESSPTGESPARHLSHGATFERHVRGALANASEARRQPKEKVHAGDSGRGISGNRQEGSKVKTTS